MIKEGNHPMLEDIMAFVSLSKDTLDKKCFAEYFSMVSHFVKCEKCRKIKDEMIEFLKKTEEILSLNETNNDLKMKMYYSLFKLDALENFKNKEILFAAKGKVSSVEGESFMQRIEFDKNESTLNNRIDVDEKEICQDNSYDNCILLENNKLEVSFGDDGKDEHSVLIIPENIENSPIICNMKKETDKWSASCECPDDDYEVVVL